MPSNDDFTPGQTRVRAKGEGDDIGTVSAVDHDDNMVWVLFNPDRPAIDVDPDDLEVVE